ncbi:MAG: hypothetical protein WB611_03685 [Stellaceae bacterium]
MINVVQIETAELGFDVRPARVADGGLQGRATPGFPGVYVFGTIVLIPHMVVADQGNSGYLMGTAVKDISPRQHWANRRGRRSIIVMSVKTDQST